MAVRPLCLVPDPVLRGRARLVEAFSEDIRRLVQDLIETMHANDGIGLAAPQIGCDLQVFVANPSQRSGQEVVMINPNLEAASGRAGMVEGCLSLPEIWEKVRRAARIRMSGLDAVGKPLVVDAEGLLAIALQHEFDHLQGRLFIDHLSWARRMRLRVSKAHACG